MDLCLNFGTHCICREGEMTRKWNPKEFEVTVTTASGFDVDVRVTDYIPAGKDSGHPTDPPPDPFQVEYEIVARDRFLLRCIQDSYVFDMLYEDDDVTDLIDRLAELEIGDERVRDAIEARYE